MIHELKFDTTYKEDSTFMQSNIILLTIIFYFTYPEIGLTITVIIIFYFNPQVVLIHQLKVS